MNRYHNPIYTSILKMMAMVLLLTAGVAWTQDNPIVIRLEHYIVSVITAEDGSKQERFFESETARPGEVIEYRLFVSNQGERTLPAGTVMITGPIPEGTSFVDGSATPDSENVLTEFSADGSSYASPPIIIEPEDGAEEERRIVAPEDYQSVRWTILVPTEPYQEQTFFYRVIVE